MYKARTRDLYADVNTKLSEVGGWDTRAHKFKTREGRSQGTPDVICTSAEVADKVVRATFCANICSDNMSACGHELCFHCWFALDCIVGDPDEAVHSSEGGNANSTSARAAGILAGPVCEVVSEGFRTERVTMACRQRSFYRCDLVGDTLCHLCHRLFCVLCGQSLSEPIETSLLAVVQLRFPLPRQTVRTREEPTCCASVAID